MIDTDDIQRAVEVRELVLTAVCQAYPGETGDGISNVANAITSALIIAEALTNLNGGIAHG